MKMKGERMMNRKERIIKNNKAFLKKTPEELEEYMKFKKRGGSVPPKKGKGSFRRKAKHRASLDT